MAEHNLKGNGSVRSDRAAITKATVKNQRCSAKTSSERRLFETINRPELTMKKETSFITETSTALLTIAESRIEVSAKGVRNTKGAEPTRGANVGADIHGQTSESGKESASKGTRATASESFNVASKTHRSVRSTNTSSVFSAGSMSQSHFTPWLAYRGILTARSVFAVAGDKISHTQSGARSIQALPGNAGRRSRRHPARSGTMT
jgi:hypothetical protein